MKQYRNQIIAGVVIVVLLVAAFLWGGNAPGSRGGDVQQAAGTEDISGAPVPPAEAPQATEAASAESAAGVPATSVTPQDTMAPAVVPTVTPAATKVPVVAEIKQPDAPATVENKPVKQDNQPMTAEEKVELAAQMAGGTEEGTRSAIQGLQLNGAAVPAGMPQPIEPQNAVISDKKMTCTLSVRCDTILKNIAWLDAEKVELVPQDGVILPEQTVTFYEGESVFNLLLREMKRNKIHFEYQNTPLYNSAYIEGIHNLYEFDCGELSGWIYKVNGWFPSYGCSKYQLREGDCVEWVYTCDLGTDVGRN